MGRGVDRLVDNNNGDGGDRPKNHRRDWLAATRWEKYNFCFVVNNRDMRDPRITDGTVLRRHGGKNIISAS